MDYSGAGNYVVIELALGEISEDINLFAICCIHTCDISK
jgi:hypothetical protein